MGKAKKLILIDGYNFLFRSFYSLPPLLNSNGVEVGAVYGYLNILSKVVKSEEYSHIAVILDSGEKSFRNDLYSEYKANREKAPDSLIPQFALMREATLSMNITTLEQKGFEADDIIATIAKKAENIGYQVKIISTDKDLMQLITPNVVMLDSFKNKTYDELAVQEKFSVLPSQILSYLSLVGDASDNIPGVPGIGAKTAVKLLGEFANIQAMMTYLAGDIELKDKKLIAIKNNIDLLQISASLVKLDENVEICDDLSMLEKQEIKAVDFIKFLLDNDFYSIYEKYVKVFDGDLPVEVLELLEKNQGVKKIERKTIFVNAEGSLQELQRLLLCEEKIAIDYEWDEDNKLVLVSVVTKTKVYVIVVQWLVGRKMIKDNSTLFDSMIDGEGQSTMNHNHKEVSNISTQAFLVFLEDIMSMSHLKKIIIEETRIFSFIQELKNYE